MAANASVSCMISPSLAPRTVSPGGPTSQGVGRLPVGAEPHRTWDTIVHVTTAED